MAARETPAADAYTAVHDEDLTPALARFDRLIGPVVDTETPAGF